MAPILIVYVLLLFLNPQSSLPRLLHQQDIRSTISVKTTTTTLTDDATFLKTSPSPDAATSSMTTTSNTITQPSLLPSKLSPFSLPSNPRYDRAIARLVQAHPDECTDKERLLGILARALGGSNSSDNDENANLLPLLSVEDCIILPTWTEVVELYGSEPVIYGLETCATYRQHLQQQRDGVKSAPFKFEKRSMASPKPQPRVAGLFNTGTNALAQSFQLNIAPLHTQSHSANPYFHEYNLLGGKHVPPKAEWYSTFRTTAARRWNVFPVVLVRDPFRWMSSMCKSSYNAEWQRGYQGRCPNLVPTAQERHLPEFANVTTTFPVAVSLRAHYYYDYYTSLADLWSQWNQQYIEAEFPRILIRFEDTLFHAEQVMYEIKQCLGLLDPSNQTDAPQEIPFEYFLDKSKKSPTTADFATALSKYGRASGRYDSITEEDRAYLQTALDPRLMQLFHYPNISPPATVKQLVHDEDENEVAQKDGMTNASTANRSTAATVTSSAHSSILPESTTRGKDTSNGGKRAVQMAFDDTAPAMVALGASAINIPAVNELTITAQENPASNISQPAAISKDDDDKKAEDTSADPCKDKERLLNILLRAGVPEFEPGRNITIRHYCSVLPTWSQVVALYGDKPVVYGLETCHRYIDSLKMVNGTIQEPLPRVAGLFNTGTNALQQSFSLNLKYMEDPTYYQIFTGKHVAPSEKLLSLRAEPDAKEQFQRLFPVAMIRDPFRWMQSMCKKSYRATWERGSHGRCPNLHPIKAERKMKHYQRMKRFNVTVDIWGHQHAYYDSLASMWSEWNRVYWNASFPRLMIRFEDMLFHAEDVFQQISECLHMPLLKNEYQYLLQSSKALKSSADFVTAMAKYGREDGRYDGLAKEEYDYLQEALDPELMKSFHYLSATLDRLN